MDLINRRHFLKSAAALASLPIALREALAVPAARRTGSIMDVQHVVILMQENRSFDHYFGCLRGVRGFGDPRAVTLPSGKSVFHQPIGPGVSEAILPFRFDSANSAAERLPSLDHSWKGQHSLWKTHDAWIPVKSPMTMGYFQRDDIPFYYALADAFTVLDAYHASVFGPTGPNRLFLFSGTSGLAVKDHGPQTVENIDDGNWTADQSRDDTSFKGFTWTTYAERLEAAGVSWKVYQEFDNFGDNPLSCFAAFRGGDAKPSLLRRARDMVAGSSSADGVHSFGDKLVAAFAADVAQDRLPQVSWLVAPTAASEHPDAPPTIGSAFTAALLAALAANPKVWAKTVFILNYDENDGFFDHVPPPLPPIRPALGASTVAMDGEALGAEPFGLGLRVPAMVISPWTRGGWVNSQLFDHSSVIRFLEARFGVIEPNITPWRRAVTGDLTSVFDFSKTDPDWVALPDVAPLIGRLQAASQLAEPAVPAQQSLPRQEKGVRPARPLPYDLRVESRIDERCRLSLANRGAAGACLQLWSHGAAQPGPWFFTVEAGKTLDTELIGLAPRESYDLSLFGPNGYLRQWRGGGGRAVEATISGDGGLLLIEIANDGAQAVDLSLNNCAYGERDPRHIRLAPGQRHVERRDIAAQGHWYDVSVTCDQDPAFLRRAAGHIETGAPSISDPAIGQDLRLV